ncbi:MAG TPA: amidase family protein, partial [Reyranella sp.]|nr:amidase family protein [Reyranella sp.]
APRFDTVGWFARDAAMLKRVSEVLLGGTLGVGFDRMIVLDDAFARADEAVRSALEPGLALIEAQLGPRSHTTLAPDGLDDWLEAFRVTQAGEIWASLGEWITQAHPVFGKGVGERFDAASKVTPEVSAAARIRADAIASELDERIGDGDLLCLPTSPCIAPLRGTASDAVEIDYRRRTMALLCASGLGGLPQLTIPVATVDGAPVGLSIMARRGRDIDLLAFAADVFADMA